jgi:hypothetical protein
MKTWLVESYWLRKRDKREFYSRFVVVNEGEDPIQTIRDLHELDSTYTYLRGTCQEVIEPLALMHDSYLPMDE